MASTVAAMKGKLGTTDYYIIAMKAKELVEKIGFSSTRELEWKHIKLEEIEQREINLGRVKSQIAPYLATDEDRFFGAVILAAKGFDESNFEPLADIATKGLPVLYKTQAKMMGFLTFTGGEKLIPLDGQHRLLAIKFAIEGHDGKNEIKNFIPNSKLANEDVTVILIPYEVNKARKIFTKVNRYAKPTTTGQNLVTDDDDIIAILSRLVTNKIIGPDLVKYKSNTLTPSHKARYFTTLAALAKSNTSILVSSYGPITHKASSIAPDRVKMYTDKIIETWNSLTKDIELFADMLEDKGEKGDRIRKQLRETHLISRPIPQICLVSAYMKLTNLSPTQENPKKRKLTKKETIEKLNKIDWRIGASTWDRLLVNGDKIITKNERIAIDIICYIAGEHLTEKEKEMLLQRYRKLFPEDKREEIKLPPQV